MIESRLGEDKIEECKKIFNEMDIDGTGDIDLQELGNCLNSLGCPLKETELNKIIKEFDENKSGRLDFEEFLSIVAMNMQDSHNEEDLVECFNVLDRNKDGKVTCQDLILVMTLMGDRISKEEAEEIICEIDPDNNGYIKYEDYLKMRSSNKY